MSLSSRAVDVLRAIIQDYIAHAEPVGSRALSRGHELDVSPATIRNVMSDLEELGYLAKPHASAGRVPTELAFRFYVDTLLQIRPLPSRGRERVNQGYDPVASSVPDLMHQTGRILHRLTHHAAIVATPRLSQTRVRHLKFIRLREDRVLAVLVSHSDVVENRVLRVDFEVDQAQLDRATNFLDELLANCTLVEAKARLEVELADERARYDELAVTALALAKLTFDAPGDADLIVEGQASLLDAPELAEPTQMRSLLEALEDKERVLRLLERAELSPGIQIFIGSESQIGDEHLSVVAASYRRGDQVLGTLGVIGPTRMDYARVVPLVEYTASQLSRVFDEVHE